MSELQSVMFPTFGYTEKKSRKWLRLHGIVPIKKVHTTENYYRYRIEDPKKYKRFITHVMPGSGIRLIVGFK